MKKYLLMLPVLFTLSFVDAQDKLAYYFPGAGDPAGKANVETLINSFIKPLGQDIAVLPSMGWYSTAKTHKKWGFDLSVSVNSVFVSNEDKYYNFPAGMNGLNYLGTDLGNDPIPTVYGPESENPIFEITTGPNADVRYKGADGFDPESEYFLSAQPIYTIQGGIGLFKNTDLRFRITPQTTISTVKFGNWGVGVMHDLLQYISPESKFDLSVFLGYTNISGTVDLSGIYSGNGQEAKVSASGFTGQALISKEFSVLTVYGALGYDIGKTSIDINGTYTVDEYIDADSDTESPLPQGFTLSNPFTYDYEKSGFRFTGGLRLRLGPVTLNGDYSFVGDKRVLAVGLGFLTDAKSNKDY